jgi:nucleoside-diphosphate-sugar epimerase
MSQKRILVTGASGCIGQYISEALIEETDYELFLLVRNPDKLKIDYKVRPGINILPVDMRDIELVGDLLKTINQAVLTAAAWGGEEETREINVSKTIQLINSLNPEVCEQVIYFSTASLLDRHQQLLPEAGEIGTEYIRTKYECFKWLPELALGDRITTLFPTLVFGGDGNKPYSHISAGLPEIVKWIDIIRYLKADGSFHFIHARDIAQVVRYLIDNIPNSDDVNSHLVSRKFVLGNQRLTADMAVEEAAAYFGKKINFQIALSLELANFLIVLFRIQMAPWDRFCLQYRHFSYENPVNPTTFGLSTYCPTFSDILRTRGIKGAEGK